MRIVSRESHKFDGKLYRRLLSYHSKVEAVKEVKKQRLNGYNARVTSTKLPTKGYSLYHVWIRYPYIQGIGKV